MKFEVVFADTEEVLNGLSFDNSKEAQAFAKAEQKHYTRKLKIRKIVEDVNWRQREATRLADGTYTPLPAWWQEAEWWKDSDPAKEHFAHIAKDGVSIAYTLSDEKGKLDIQNKLAPARYLSRYFQDMSSHQIRDIAASMKREQYTLHFSAKPEDFEKVYEDQAVSFEGSSCNSCMSYSRHHWHSQMPHHPAYAYGAGDLQIAWLQYKEDDDFRVAARTIVYPAKNTFSRVYADSMESFGVLKQLLLEKGFEENHDLEGARLLKIEIPSSNNLFVCSYIDGDSTSLVDTGKYFRIVACDSDEAEAFSSGTGYVRLPTYATCGCGNRCVESRLTWVIGREGQSARVCSDCLEADYFLCNVTGEYCHNDIPNVEVIRFNYFNSPNNVRIQARFIESHTKYCEGYGALVYDTSLVTYVGEHGVQKKVSLHWLNHTCGASCLPDKNDGFYYDPRYHDVVGVNGYVSKLRGEPNKKPKVDQPAKDVVYKDWFQEELESLNIKARISTLPRLITPDYITTNELFYDESLDQVVTRQR